METVEVGAKTPHLIGTKDNLRTRALDEGNSFLNGEGEGAHEVANYDIS